MAEVPALIDGFLRALCGIANGMYSEGGMSCTYHKARHSLPILRPTAPARTRSWPNSSTWPWATTAATRGHLVWELRRVVREASGAELVAARVDDDPGEVCNTLTLWWRSAAGGLDSAALFWSID